MNSFTQPMLADPFAAGPSFARLKRPALKRSDSAISLPTPPGSSDSDGEDAEGLRNLPSLFTRPRTNRPKHVDRIKKSDILLTMDVDEVEELTNPFIETPDGVPRVAKGLPNQTRVTTYVFRGKRIQLECPLDPSDDLDPFHDCAPKLLFPKPIAAPAVKTEREKSTSPSPRYGVTPPTPVSIRKKAPPAMRYAPYVRRTQPQRV